jgi:NDP-sugar pyrophosphorylase family protein
MRAVIIAGGSGTRLRPLTYNTPKPMVPLFGKPFLLYQIELLRKHGITEIVINLHYLSDSIKNVLGDGSQYGVKLFYSYESEPLGTAGAVKNAAEFFNDEPMLVFNGDVLTDVDLSAVIDTHQRTRAKATLTLIKVQDPTQFGLVFLDGEQRITRFHEKPTPEEAAMFKVDTVNAGIYVLDPDVFQYVPAGEPHMFERGLFPHLLNIDARMSGHVTNAYWIDIGNPAKYMEAHVDVLRGRVKVEMPAVEMAPNLWVAPDAHIDDSAEVRGPVFIGSGTKIRKRAMLNEYAVLESNVIIDDRASVAHAVVGADSLVGEDAQLQRCIVGRSSQIGPHSRLSGDVVLADDSVIGKGTRLGA